MHQKKIQIFIIKIVLISLSLLLAMGFNYIVDPLQFYRKAAWFKPQLYIQERYQNPGLAKNFDYDTVIIGTSMTQNFSPRYIKEKMKLNTMKLSMSAATAAEQKMILNLALQTGRVKNVFWGLDYSSFKGKIGRISDETVSFPYYLYDNNIFNDYKYLINSNTTELSIKAVVNTFRGSNYNMDEALEVYSNWNSTAIYGRKQALNSYKKLLKNGSFKTGLADYKWDCLKQNMDKDLLSIVRSNPKINFYLFFTPSSVLAQRYYYEKSPGVFGNLLKTKKYIVEQCSSLNNVKIYDFQSDGDIVLNLDLYKDISHYREAINRLMIDYIAGGMDMVTMGNIDESLSRLKNWVLNYKF